MFSANESNLSLDEDEIFENLVEMNAFRIDSFFEKSSIKTQLDKEHHNSTLLSPIVDQHNIIKLANNTHFRKKTSVSLQKWQGYITSFNEHSFTAIVQDLTNDNPDEEIEISVNAISPDDLHLVTEGAHFYRHIGYENLSGTTQKYSKILFRRMPRWSMSAFKKAEKLEKELNEFISALP